MLLLGEGVGAVPKNPSIKKLELFETAALIWVVGELSKLAKLLLTKLLVLEPVGVVMRGPLIGAEERVDPLKSKPPNKSSRSRLDVDGAVDAFELVKTGADGPLSKLSNPPSRLSKEFCHGI